MLQIVGACNPELQRSLAARGGSTGSGSGSGTGREQPGREQPHSSSQQQEQEDQQQSVVEDATGFIVPLLLDKGLLEPSPEGRGFSLGLLLRVVKVSLPTHIHVTLRHATSYFITDPDWLIG